MNKKLIEEQTLLALFEGAIKEDHCHYMIPALNRIVWVEKMLYSSDWNWIMRIVDKIETYKYIFHIHKHWGALVTDPVEESHYCTITDGNGHEIIDVAWQNAKIEAVYKACVEFVKYYNANLKKDGSN